MEGKTYPEWMEEQFEERLKLFILEQAINLMDSEEFRDFGNYLSQKRER